MTSIVTDTIVRIFRSQAAQALLGKDFRVTRERGIPLVTPLADAIVATVHPSSVLRAPTDEARRQARADLVHDLAAAADVVKVLRASPA